ncbi:MAG TPA: hypothetical protein VG222_10835, partial [Vicinamibacterales bacterium]|nr:hypothetical protein [Vicinamibacterales bacterium]
LRAALIAFAAISFFASDVSKIFGPDGVDWAKAAGVYLWPSVLVVAVLLRSARYEASSNHEAHEVTKH